MTYKQRSVIACVLASMLVLPLGCTNKNADEKPPVVSEQPAATPGSPATSTAPMTEPAEKGAKLADITQPPTETLAMIDQTAATADSSYSIAFEPFGYGPGGNGAKAYVIKVTASKPVGSPKKPFDFKGRNVLVQLAPGSDVEPTSGGSYAGTLTLKKQGELLLPELSKVRVK